MKRVAQSKDKLRRDSTGQIVLNKMETPRANLLSAGSIGSIGRDNSTNIAN